MAHYDCRYCGAGPYETCECEPPKPIVKPVEKQQPPLGLRPRCIANTFRMQEILDAMQRYCAEAKKIPVEWLEELSTLNMEVV